MWSQLARSTLAGAMLTCSYKWRQLHIGFCDIVCTNILKSLVAKTVPVICVHYLASDHSMTSRNDRVFVNWISIPTNIIIVLTLTLSDNHSSCRAWEKMISNWSLGLCQLPLTSISLWRWPWYYITNNSTYLRQHAATCMIKIVFSYS